MLLQQPEKQLLADDYKEVPAASLHRLRHAQAVGADGPFHVWAAGEPCSQGAKSSEKQPSRIA